MELGQDQNTQKYDHIYNMYFIHKLYIYQENCYLLKIKESFVAIYVGMAMHVVTLCATP